MGLLRVIQRGGRICGITGLRSVLKFCLASDVLWLRLLNLLNVLCRLVKG